MELMKSAGKAVRRKVKQKIVFDPARDDELKSPLVPPVRSAPVPAFDSTKVSVTKPDKKAERPKSKALPDDAQFEQIEAEVKEAVPPPNRAGIQPLDQKRPPTTTGKPRSKK